MRKIVVAMSHVEISGNFIDMENGAGMKTVIRKRMENMKAKSEKGNHMGKVHTLSTVELKVKYSCSHS